MQAIREWGVSVELGGETHRQRREEREEGREGYAEEVHEGGDVGECDYVVGEGGEDETGGDEDDVDRLLLVQL